MPNDLLRQRQRGRKLFAGDHGRQKHQGKMQEDHRSRATTGCVSKDVVVRDRAYTYPLFRTGRGLDAVATLDYISLEADRARTAVQLEEQAASIAQDAARLVTTP